MSHKLTPTTDSIQGFYAPQDFTSPFATTPHPMPQDEHQYPRRLVRLSDISQRNQVNGERASGSTSSPKRSWVQGLLKKRREKKDIRETHIDGGKGIIPRRHSLTQNVNNLDCGRPQTWSNHNTPVVSTTRESFNTEAVEPQSQFEAGRTNNSRTPLFAARQSQQVDGSTSQPPLPVVRQPVSDYPKRGGKVPKHQVKISLPSVPRRSIHLVHTPSNNYQAEDSPRKIRSAKHLTTFGEFIDAPADESLHISEPNSPAEEVPSPPFQDIPIRLDIQPETSPDTHGVSRDEEDFFPDTPSSLSPLDKIFQDHGANSEPQECSMCGTPNSPCTKYGNLGLWLCTACRSPTSPIEFPPRIDSRIIPERHRELSRSSNTSHLTDDTPTCEDCHTMLPPNERDGNIFCSWCCRELSKAAPASNPNHSPARLTLLRARRQNSLSSVATQDAEEEWGNFDSDSSQHTGASSPPPAETWNEHRSSVRAQEHYHWRKPEDEMKPIPPLKDIAYSPSRQPNASLYTNTFSSPPIRGPPPPPPPPAKEMENFPPQALYTPDRASFYPDLALPSPFDSSPPLPPKIPPRPIRKHDRARKTSSVYPPTPEASDFATNFPYPPPPIPEDIYTRYRPERASSIYPDEPAPRLATPDWERSHKRNTNFYDYWEVILGEDGRTSARAQ